jgi:[ribosomal protein S18]-alanine N-acetyltransferase
LLFPFVVALVSCRPYIAADFDALYALEVACFESAFRFPRRYMRTLTTARNTAVWVAEQGTGLAGFGITTWSRHRSLIAAYIETLEVAPEARGRGLGRALLEQLERSAWQAGAVVAGLHVDAQNGSAVHLYERSGYTCQGRKENFYPQGRAALIYTKELREPPPTREGTENAFDLP